MTRCLRGGKLLSLSRNGPSLLTPNSDVRLAARIRYYNEMGIYDFYRRPVSIRLEDCSSIAIDEQGIAVSQHTLEPGEEMSRTQGHSRCDAGC